MKKLLLRSILLTLALVAPLPARAEVNISIGFPLPPPIVFPARPEVIMVPDAYGVYAVPDIDVDIFFWNGWWWRPWGGRWYRSYHYDRGWAYYSSVPYFYNDIDPGWRGYYRDHHWHGHRWDYVVSTTLVIEGSSYAVRSVQPYGLGMTELVLEAL